MFTIQDLPERMQLTGSLHPLSVCLVTAPCHSVLLAKTGISFGSMSIRALKSKHMTDIYVNAKEMKKIHDILVKVINALSFDRETTQEDKGKYILTYINTLIEQYIDTHSKKIGTNKFASLCLPLGISAEHSCSCGSNGAMGLTSLTNNQGMTHEY